MSMTKMFNLHRRLIKKANLTPFDRHFIAIETTASKERDGKAMFSEAEKKELVDSWQPATADEAREFNRYNQAWKLTMTAELEATAIFYEIKAKLQELALFLTSVKDGALEPFAFLGEPYSSIKLLNDDKTRAKIQEISILMCETIVDLYSTLLSFGELFDKISDAYGTDLSYKVKGFIKDTKEHIGRFNALLALKEYEKPRIDTETIGPRAGATNLYETHILKLLERPNARRK